MQIDETKVFATEEFKDIDANRNLCRIVYQNVSNRLDTYCKVDERYLENLLIILELITI